MEFRQVRFAASRAFCFGLRRYSAAFFLRRLAASAVARPCTKPKTKRKRRNSAAVQNKTPWRGGLQRGDRAGAKKDRLPKRVGSLDGLPVSVTVDGSAGRTSCPACSSTAFSIIC